MSNFQNHTLPASINFGTERFTQNWCWGAIPGRWSVGAALVVSTSVSLVIWAGVLLALLN